MRREGALTLVYVYPLEPMSAIAFTGVLIYSQHDISVQLHFDHRPSLVLSDDRTGATVRQPNQRLTLKKPVTIVTKDEPLLNRKYLPSDILNT